MDKKTFAHGLCEIYSIEYTAVVKKKHGKTPEITFGYLCELIFLEKTAVNIEKAIGISSKTLRKTLKEAYPDLAGNKGTVWRVELLAKLSYRRCHSCDLDKPLEEFYNATNSRDGKGWRCKDCCKDDSRLYHSLHPEVLKASNRKRKAIIRGALDDGANLSTIKLIYKHCPEGHHVDHIIPLAKGGKHHENNLCYLPAVLNMQKQDKLPEEVPYIMKFAIYPLESNIV